MLISYEEFHSRADAIRERIAQACARAGRNPDQVRLLAVTKTHPAEAAGYAFRYGLASVGENRVQEAVAKKAAAAPGLKWELIGHLQTNKAALAARTFDRIQSVDSEKLLRHLERAAAEAGKILPVLLQVNAGADPAKFGVSNDSAQALLESALACPHLRVEGFMTIAPLDSDRSAARRAFEALRSIRDACASRFALALPEVSMGMTGDLEEAVEAGSTLVRVGTALYGERPPQA